MQRITLRQCLLGFLGLLSFTGYHVTAQIKERNCIPERSGEPSVLVKAVRNNNFEEFKRLMTAGENLNAFDYDSETPLMAAVTYERIEFVRELIKVKVDVNQSNSTGSNALMRSGERRRADIAKILIDAGAKIDEQNRDGATALLLAARSGNLETVNLLIETGANLYQKDKSGNTAFLLACQGGSTEVVKRLLSLGFDAESANNYGNFGLILAARTPAILKMLLDAGAKVDRRTKINGYGNMTALYVAAQNGYTESVRTLIEAGADVNIPDFDGTTPLNRAKMGKHLEIIELLKRAGAKE